MNAKDIHKLITQMTQLELFMGDRESLELMFKALDYCDELVMVEKGAGEAKPVTNEAMQLKIVLKLVSTVVSKVGVEIYGESGETPAYDALYMLGNFLQKVKVV